MRSGRAGKSENNFVILYFQLRGERWSFIR